MPPVEARNTRRSTPSFLLADSVRSLMRASTRCCCSVWGTGMYSPLEIMRVGMGDRSGSAVSARAHFAI